MVSDNKTIKRSGLKQYSPDNMISDNKIIKTVEDKWGDVHHQVLLKDISKKEYFKRIVNAKTYRQKVFVKSHYVRDGSGEWCCSNIFDMNDEIFLTGKTKVWIGFTC